MESTGASPFRVMGHMARLHCVSFASWYAATAEAWNRHGMGSTGLEWENFTFSCMLHPCIDYAVSMYT